MPFTPFHMGPGILVKAVLQGSFSLMVFGWSQIIMDLQPLFSLITGKGHLHGFSHTYIGALLIAVIAILTGKHISELGLAILGITKSNSPSHITWQVAFVSALIGTYSHVALDSIMHADVEPLYPFSPANHMLRIISISHLHQFCLYTGLLGTGLFYVMHLAINSRKHHNKSGG